MKKSVFGLYVHRSFQEHYYGRISLPIIRWAWILAIRNACHVIFVMRYAIRKIVMKVAVLMTLIVETIFSFLLKC